jgi:hypothetical protein
MKEKPDGKSPSANGGSVQRMVRPTVDMRSPLAKARDEWFESDEGERCRAGITSGQYLQNRLESAFLAGANWAAQHLGGKV